MAADMHIYVPEDLKKEVKEAKLPVSQIAQKAFRREIAKKRLAAETGAEELEITLWSEDDVSYTATFHGTWLLAPDPDETRTADDGYDSGAYWGVALLEGGDFLAYTAHVNEGWAPNYEIIGDLEEGLPGDIFIEAAMAFNALLQQGNANAKGTDGAPYEVRVPLDLI